MKSFKSASILVSVLFFLWAAASCAVIVREDNGSHKGWNKNSNNPHHNNSANPGKGNKNNK
jgi:hypothetical protein